MKGKFDTDKPLGEALQVWWNELQKRTGERAELRRAKNVTDVILLPAFQQACLRFKPFFHHEEHWQVRLAMILGLLAHVRKPTNQKLALQMAGKPKPEISELRFRRLIQRNRDELYLAMIRIIRQLGNQTNLHDLANSVYYWGDKVKQEWAYEYFPNTPDIASA